MTATEALKIAYQQGYATALVDVADRLKLQAERLIANPKGDDANAKIIHTDNG